jgi:hypothetical protein
VKRWGQGGELIVSNGNGSLPKDIVFVGPPTRYDPLDDEAREITEVCRPSWIHPIESLQGQGFSDNLLQVLSKQLADAVTKQPAAPIIGIDPADFAKLQERVEVLIAQNAELRERRV